MHINLDGSEFCVDVAFFMPELPGMWGESLDLGEVVKHHPGEESVTPISDEDDLYAQIVAAVRHELYLTEPLTPEDIARAFGEDEDL